MTSFGESAEAGGVSEFVEGVAVKVDVGCDFPGFGVVEVEVAGDGLGVGGSGIEGVGEDAAGAVEGVGIAVSAGSEEDVEVAG